MIRFAKDNKNYMIKRSSHWIVITSTISLSIRSNSGIKLDTGLNFWFDGGTIGLLLEAKLLPPVLKIIDKTFLGRGRLVIELYNNSSVDVEIDAPFDICYLVPLVSSGYANLEIEEIDVGWFTAASSYGSIIDES